MHFQKIKTPYPSRPSKLDDFDQNVVRRLVHQHFTNKDVLTLNMLRTDLEYEGIMIGRTALASLLKKLGNDYNLMFSKDDASIIKCCNVSKAQHCKHLPMCAILYYNAMIPHLRIWPNIKPTLGQRLMFAGLAF